MTKEILNIIVENIFNNEEDKVIDELNKYITKLIKEAKIEVVKDIYYNKLPIEDAMIKYNIEGTAEGE